MNLFRNNGREIVKNAQTVEPHTARRAVRYAAADNTQAALQRQFPGVGFVLNQQASIHPMGKQAVQSTEVGVQDDDFAQAA